MQIKPLISIIIPVYNRENLLTETLDSIILQSQSDWECILVDDCSTDSTYTVMESYKEKDFRFKIFKRPNNLKRGANACRNYGFLQASGSYIKWFDSDDIMLPKHLEIAYQTIINDKLDFVVTDTVNFDNETKEIVGKPYDFDRKKSKISAMNFALNSIGWITDDFLGTRKIVEKIGFNENITTDGDEYNFFVRMLNQPFKGKFVDEIVTHRRIHSNTLTSLNGKDTLKFKNKIQNIKYQTAKDLIIFDDVELIRWFLSGYMNISYDLALKNEAILYKNEAFELICGYFSRLKGVAFIVALHLARYSKKGYVIMKYARS